MRLLVASWFAVMATTLVPSPGAAQDGVGFALQDDGSATEARRQISFEEMAKACDRSSAL